LLPDQKWTRGQPRQKSYDNRSAEDDLDDPHKLAR
jgi:hypothetical protein